MLEPTFNYQCWRLRALVPAAHMKIVTKRMADHPNWTFYGSALTRDPHSVPEGSDLDIAVFDGTGRIIDQLLWLGATPCSADYPDFLNRAAAFAAFRHGYLNFVVIADRGFFDRYLAAAEATFDRKLADKEARVRLWCSDVWQYTPEETEAKVRAWKLIAEGSYLSW